VENHNLLFAPGEKYKRKLENLSVLGQEFEEKWGDWGEKK